MQTFNNWALHSPSKQILFTFQHVYFEYQLEKMTSNSDIYVMDNAAAQ